MYNMEDLVFESCEVEGTTAPYTLIAAMSDAHLRFRDVYADGTTDLVVVAKTLHRSPNGAKVEIFEASTLTYVAGSPPPDTLSRGTVIKSKTAAGVSTSPVDWLDSDIVGISQVPLLSLIGYRGIPQKIVSAAYSTTLADDGRHIYHPAADTTPRAWTIDASLPYRLGATITFINARAAGAITLDLSAGELWVLGTLETGARTLAAGGSATVLKETSADWTISGIGLS